MPETPSKTPAASSAASSLPLWRLLQGTASVVAAVRSGRSMTALLETQSPALRPGVQALSFQVMRWLGRAQALRVQLARKAPPASADALLCTALALCWDEARAPYSAFTLVDQTVEAARQNKETRAQANFINACLRRFLRERTELIRATDDSPMAQWNHPLWWIQQLQKDHPTHWQAILMASQSPAPMALRVNVTRSTVPDYLAHLEAVGVTGHAVGTYGI